MSGRPSIRMAFHRSSSSPYNNMVSESGGIPFPVGTVSVAVAWAWCLGCGDPVTWEDVNACWFIWMDPSCSNCDCKCKAETGSLKYQQRHDGSCLLLIVVLFAGFVAVVWVLVRVGPSF